MFSGIINKSINSTTTLKLLNNSQLFCFVSINNIRSYSSSKTTCSSFDFSSASNNSNFTWGCNCMGCMQKRKNSRSNNNNNNNNSTRDIHFQATIQNNQNFKLAKTSHPHIFHYKQNQTRNSSDDSKGKMISKNDIHVQKILANNRAWVEKTKEKDPDFFIELGKKKQTPKYLYFGCSDSRVPVNSILGLGPGEVFVHRNIGNLVPVNDLNALSVLEYAVGHLDVTDIIVSGHYDCGAIRAASMSQDLGILENWLRLIRDVYRMHKDHLDMISNTEERHRRLVELNVMEQCLNLFKTGVVQRKRNFTREQHQGENTYPRIHGMTFDPSEGLLKKLDINFKQHLGSLDHIYSLGYKGPNKF